MLFGTVVQRTCRVPTNTGRDARSASSACYRSRGAIIESIVWTVPTNAIAVSYVI